MITYLNPKSYCSNPRLDDVLIAMPSYGSPDVRTSSCLSAAASSGASIVTSVGCSDVALHRNLLAAMILNALRAKPGLQYVLLLDSDMVFGIEDIAFLRYCVRDVCRPVTALYCKRGKPQQLAFKPVANGHVLGATEIVPSGVVLPAVEGGLGFVLLPAELFLHLCAAVPRLPGIAQAGAVFDVPLLFESRPSMREELDLVAPEWLSEDIGFCRLLAKGGCGLLAAPIRVGHVSTLALQPDESSEWMR